MFKNLYRKAESYFLKRADEAALRVMAASKTSRGGSAYSGQINRNAESMAVKTLDDWKMSILMATNQDSPNFLFWYELIQNLMLDNHLVSVIESRIAHSQRSNYKLTNDKGDENTDITWMFQRTWFEEFIYLALMSKWQGRKLLEMIETDPVTGELKTITEIPMTNFNAKKGIITKDPGDDNGWSYRDGVFQNYYLQVGKDNDMGVLAQMAPVILAKKLAMGSWLDFVEKYGIPPLFITTEREDDRRLQELFAMATNFKAANFMIGRGAEKFEIPNITTTNAQTVFDALIDRCNSEISKRVLGGTGITDEKSFVGSAEIQYQLAKDRYESDKLFLSNIINQQLIPRLIKLSPVYAPLNGYYFEWDNAEVFDSAKIADLVTKLGPYFYIDPEYIEQKTSIPILGVKETSFNSQQEDGKKSEKSE